MLPDGYLKIVAKKKVNSMFKHITWLSRHYSTLERLGYKNEGLEKALISLHEETKLIYKKVIGDEEECD